MYPKIPPVDGPWAPSFHFASVPLRCSEPCALLPVGPLPSWYSSHGRGQGVHDARHEPLEITAY